MIKRWKLFVWILVLSLLVVTACGKADKDNTKDESNKGQAKDLIDGDYLEKGPVGDHGNYSLAKMRIKDGQIEDFKYMEIIATTGQEKNKNNYNYPEGLQAIENLNQQFQENKNLEQMDFDGLTGATDTKTTFQEMVNSLLEKAGKGETYQAPYIDGQYEAIGDEPVHGWLPHVEIKVKYGQIIGIDYFELAVEDTVSNKVIFDEDKKPLMDEDNKPRTQAVEVKAGQRKSLENYAYLDSFEVIKGVKKLIIDNNGTRDLNLDGITGATTTRTTIIELVEKALIDAK